MKHRPLPLEIEEYIRTLAPSTQNNSRIIVRANCRRIIEENTPYTAYKLIKAKYGIDLDPSFYAEDMADLDNPPF